MTGFTLPQFRPTKQTIRSQQNSYMARAGQAPEKPMEVGAPFRTCQFIEGDPTDRNFCGEPVARQSSYCPEHHEKCWYRPDAKRSYLVKAAGA